MIKRANILYKIIPCLLAVFILALPAAAPAADGDNDCIPGLPCFTPKTINNPYDDIISQNEDDAPNYLKSSRNTCDADFMNQILARASLEAERENIMIETIISKPDSVLEYSCFEGLLNQTAYHAPRIFSETKDFSTANDGVLATVEMDGNLDDMYEPEADAHRDNEPIDDLALEVYMAEGLGDDETRLGNLFEELILSSLTDPDDDDSLKYIDANFGHTFLGGAPIGLNSNFTGEASPNAAYICAQMNATWHLAKCQNFDAPGGLFYKFETLTSVDPRQLPQACPAPESGSTDVGSMITTDNIIVANNFGGAQAHFDSAEFVSLVPGTSYQDFLRADECLPPIPTGVVVTMYKFLTGMFGSTTAITEDHNEHVCVNPGCYYDKNAGQCKKSP